MTPKQVNARLAQVSPQYTAIFEAAEDGTVDDQFAVLLCGAHTRWTILLGEGYVAVAEHGVDPDGEFFLVDHGVYKNRRQAVEKLCELLSASR